VLGDVVEAGFLVDAVTIGSVVPGFSPIALFKY
jgi:hypothetical protein